MTGETSEVRSEPSLSISQYQLASIGISQYQSESASVSINRTQSASINSEHKSPIDLEQLFWLQGAGMSKNLHGLSENSKIVRYYMVYNIVESSCPN